MVLPPFQNHDNGNNRLKCIHKLTAVSSLNVAVSIIVSAVFSGTIALGAVFVVIYFVRKRRTSSNSDSENGRIIGDSTSTTD